MGEEPRARHRSWAAIKRERLADSEAQAAYEAAGRAIALGEQVRRLREVRGMSQVELARRMGTVQSAIARIEAGGVDPKLDTLERLSRALNADLVIELRPREPAGTPR